MNMDEIDERVLLKEAEKEIEIRRKNAERTLKELEEMRRALTQREAEIHSREIHVSWCERSLVSRELAIRAREIAIRNREIAIRTRERALAQRELSILEREYAATLRGDVAEPASSFDNTGSLRQPQNVTTSLTSRSESEPVRSAAQEEVRTYQTSSTDPALKTADTNIEFLTRANSRVRSRARGLL